MTEIQVTTDKIDQQLKRLNEVEDLVDHHVDEIFVHLQAIFQLNHTPQIVHLIDVAREATNKIPWEVKRQHNY